MPKEFISKRVIDELLSMQEAQDMQKQRESESLKQSVEKLNSRGNK